MYDSKSSICGFIHHETKEDKNVFRRCLNVTKLSAECTLLGSEFTVLYFKYMDFCLK